VNLVEIKGESARLLPVAERTKALFGKDVLSRHSETKEVCTARCQELLEELEQDESGGRFRTLPSRQHYVWIAASAMILFAAAVARLCDDSWSMTGRQGPEF